MKVKLFTHTDLDGIGCAILGKLAFNDIDIEYCEYNNVNEKIEKFILNSISDTYDIVFITDISINNTVASGIDRLFKKTHVKFKLIDHHSTALWLNKYNWANVSVEDDREKVSGTSLFYNYLIKEKYLAGDEDVDLFVEKIKRYDTWLWKEKYNDLEAKQLNDLFYIYGRDEFINKMVDYLTMGEWFYNEGFLDDTDKLILKLKQNEIDKYIEKKNKEIIIKDVLGYKAGIIFAEQYHSELGNRLSELNPNLDFIIIINISKSISYRGIKDNIHLGKDIAKVYGGGGHPKAAGSPINNEIRENIIKILFDENRMA